MGYHKITQIDCLSVASKSEKLRLQSIFDLTLLKQLAKRWCDGHRYKLGGYLGRGRWDATRVKEVKDELET